MAAVQRFWFVWSPSRGVPRKKHWSYSDAYNEASRLAQQQPGEEFVVLQSLATLSIPRPGIQVQHHAG